MELKKVWMSSETRKKSRYGYRTVGKILGIVFLMTALLLIGTFLSLSLGLPQQSSSMILVLLASTLGIVLTARLGRRGMQDATIFFLQKMTVYGLWMPAAYLIMEMDFWALQLVRWRRRRFCVCRAKSHIFPKVQMKS